MKKVLTYGTFDLFHIGHLNILKRAKEHGDYLIVAVSTDEFNKIKNKESYHSYKERKQIVEAIRYVDMVIPENDWKQKEDDIRKYNIDLVIMGDDWERNENFEKLKTLCEVVYLPRTENVSSTNIKKDNPKEGLYGKQ